MNELKIFQNKEFGEVRSLMIDNEPWLVGKDVAKALGYNNPRDAISKHVEDEDKGVAKCDTLGGKQNLIIVNESGFYSLVFGSKLPSAKKFKHWVTSEVLPTLRKTGTYELPKSPAELLKLVVEAQVQTNEEVAKQDARITELEENKLLNPGEYNFLGKAIKKKVKEIKNDLGITEQKQTSQIYKSINRDLNSFIGIKTRSQFKEKDFDKALEFIEGWQLSYTDKRIIEQLVLDV